MPSIPPNAPPVNYPALREMARACWAERDEIATWALRRGKWNPGDLERCRELEQQAVALERAAKEKP